MSASTFDSPSSRSPASLATTATEVTGGSHIHRRISWSAIFGGVVLIIAVQFLLSVLGFAIGLGTVDVNAGSTPDASTIGIGAGLWWIITGIIACAFGGYVSAWLAGIEIRWDGMLHGLITWGLAMLLALYLLTTAAGGLIGSGFSALGNVTSAAGSGIKDAAQPVAQATGVTPDVLQQQAQAYLKPTNPDPANMSREDAQKEIATNLATYAKGGSDATAAKDRVIAIMAAQQHISRDDAAKHSMIPRRSFSRPGTRRRRQRRPRPTPLPAQRRRRRSQPSAICFWQPSPPRPAAPRRSSAASPSPTITGLAARPARPQRGVPRPEDLVDSVRCFVLIRQDRGAWSRSRAHLNANA